MGGCNSETLKTAHTIVLVVPSSVRKEDNLVSEIYLMCYG